MDRNAFAFLYLHANAIAELAFLRASVAAASAPPPDFTPEQLADHAATAERVMNPDADTFDWSAFDGIPGLDGDADAEALAAEATPVDLGPTFEEAMDQVGAVLDGETVPELEPYVVHLHAALPLLQARIDACLDAADASIGAVLLELPGHPAPLHGALTAAQLRVWLERYEARDEAVALAVLSVRALDPL